MAAANTSNVTNDCYPVFVSDTNCDIILGFRRALAILSMLCCVFILFVIVLFKKYKFLPQRLILYLTVSALFQAVGYAQGDYHIASDARNGHRNGVCIFQGYWVLFFDWISLLWVCCITFNIFWNSVFSKKTDKFEKFYFAVDLLLPLIICCFPFIKNTYGPAGLWCWISSVRDEKAFPPGIAMQFTVFYVPFWVISIVLMCMLILAYCYIRKSIKKYEGQYNPQAELQKKLWQEEIRPLVVFPWIYFVILVFPSINRIRYAIGYDDPDTPANFFFWFMHSITLTLHGTVYALVFGCDKQTLSRLRWNEIKSAILNWTKESRVTDYPMGEPNSKEAEVLADYDSEESKQASYCEMDDKHTDDN